ncbi:MAG: glycosyltransferase, partial [Cyanothece sp. SIO1E1]|nr:glycosyltransferase [Cyanothece sp. SIO1E1]
MPLNSNTLNSNILIYCDHLLPYSATFVRSQAAALHSFTPYYVGSRLISGLPLPPERTLVVDPGNWVGKVEALTYKLWGWAPNLVNRLQPLQPTLIHAHFGPDGVRALPLARDLAVPLVVTFHGYDITMHDSYAQRSYSHRVYLKRRGELQQKAARLIAVSEFIKRKLLACGFPAERIIRHYIGVDTTFFTPDLTIPREPIVLFAGRLVEQKGCKYLIQAMNQVQTVCPEAELVIIGDGPLRTELEQLAKSRLRRYRFLGVQSPQSVRAWMNRAQVFSVPSVTAVTGESEAFGIVFAEAQAMGLPVVSSTSGGIP